MDSKRSSRILDTYTCSLPYYVDDDGRIHFKNNTDNVVSDLDVFDDIIDTVEEVAIDSVPSLFGSVYGKLFNGLYYIVSHLLFGVFRSVFKLCYFLLGLILCNRFMKLFLST